MYVLTVTPIASSLPFDELAYFTKEPVSPGAIVAVPLGHREVPALVLAAKEASAIKQSLRQSDFTLKKIKRVISPGLFLPSFVAGVKSASKWYGVAPGLILKSLVPAAILDQKMERKTKKPIDVAAEPAVFKTEIKVLQQPPGERLASYKGMIREMLAKNQSVLIVLPGSADIAQVAPFLSRGLEDYAQIFTGQETKAKTRSVWNNALKAVKPIVAIGSPLILSLPRTDIGLVILDQENSPGYKQFLPPFLDLRRVIQHLARAAGWQLLLGDSSLSLDALYQTEQKNYAPAGTLNHRVISPAKLKLIDGRDQSGDHDRKKFAVVAAETLEQINEICQSGGSAFIFTARKGLTPTTICNDCGTTVVCPLCAAPLVVHRQTPVKNIFYCHQCGAKREIEDKCAVCGGWRLATLGIGSERVALTLSQAFPERTVNIVDADHTPTPAKIKAALAALAEPGGIVVGTEQALNYLPAAIPLVAVIGIDSLFMVPNYNMNERIFNLLIDLKSRASRRFLIQTRHPDTALFKQALEGNILDFYRQELSLRERLAYPPFKLLIKGTLVNPKHKNDGVKAETALASWGAIFYEPNNFLLKIEPAAWPDEQLLAILNGLKPAWQIDIEPTNLM